MTLGHHVYSMPPWFCFPVITPSATPHPPPRQRRHRSERTLASVRRLRPGDHVLKLSMNVAPMKHRDLLLDTCDPPRARTNRQGLERGREVKNTETETKQNEKKKRGPYVCVCCFAPFLKHVLPLRSVLGGSLEPRSHAEPSLDRPVAPAAIVARTDQAPFFAAFSRQSLARPSCSSKSTTSAAPLCAQRRPH